MNFLCHALPYLDDPLFAVSTGVPDWLSVVDRKIRARGKLAAPYADSDEPEMRAVACGVLRHIEDDRWFHGTRDFVELNMTLAVELRDLLPGDEGFRPTFVGHILIEMFLDSLWIRDRPDVAVRYYDCFQVATPDVIERCVNRITGVPTSRLSEVIERFVELKFLYDYSESTLMLSRLNQVMRRARLPLLPESVGGWLPRASKLVESRRVRLLTPPDGPNPFPEIPANERPRRAQ